MGYTFALAQGDTERQDARNFAVRLNGAGFCPPDAPPGILITSIDSFRPIDIKWIVARDDSGTMVGVLGEVIHPFEGVHNLNLVGAIEPDAQTDELALGLISSVVDLIEYGGCCGEQWPWVAVLFENSDMLPKILEVYEPYGPVTQEPTGGPGSGLVKLSGMLNPAGLTSGD